MNQLFVSLYHGASQPPKFKFPIPYALCLNYDDKNESGLRLRTSSVFYRGANNVTMVTIVTFNHSGQYFKFVWRSDKGMLDKKYSTPVNEKNQILFVRVLEGVQYKAEGIIFTRTLDQKETVYSKTLTTTLHAPTICRIEGSEFTKVTADDLKLVITGAEFVSERVVSYVLAKLEAHFKCNSILVSHKFLMTEGLLIFLKRHMEKMTKDQ